MIPKYFVLCGTKAYTTSRRPTEIYFEGQVRLRGLDSTINVVAIRPLGKPHISYSSFARLVNKSNLYVYKSNIQKCVRRQLTDKAIRSAYALMSIDVPTLLRRLPIIMIEDVLPHPSLVPLVWWMMATTKGYILSDKEVGYILGIVYLLCQIELYQVKDCPSSRESRPTLHIWSSLCPSLSKDLLWALEFRKAYGGMKCDKLLIEQTQRMWGKRIWEKDTLWEYLKHIKVPLIDLSTLDECDKSDIILEAIDQHCFTWLPSKLQSSFPHYTLYEIKGAIWYYRSRLNVREICKGSEPIRYIPELEIVYQEIKEQVESLCYWIHTSLL
jgi:hypothetical protein